MSPLGEPPLQPSPDEARSQLRGELLHPEYHEQDVVGRVLDWLARILERALDAAADAPPLSVLAALVVLALLVLGLAFLGSRARRSPAAVGAMTEEAEPRMTAAELRSRAEAALDAGRYADAVVEAFRALAAAQVERGRLDDRPGATAHEIAQVLAEAYPEHGGRVERGVELFDIVRYADRPATRDQALQALALHDELAVRG